MLRVSLAGVISRNPLAPSPRTAILIIPRGLGSRVRRTSQNHRRMRKHVGQMNARTLARTRDGWLENVGDEEAGQGGENAKVERPRARRGENTEGCRERKREGG